MQSGELLTWSKSKSTKIQGELPVQNFPFSCLEGTGLNAIKLRVLSFLIYQT